MNRCCDEWDIPDSEKELRKRVWWALHISDRFQATALGRPVSIREEVNSDLSNVLFADNLTLLTLPNAGQ